MPGVSPRPQAIAVIVGEPGPEILLRVTVFILFITSNFIELKSFASFFVSSKKIIFIVR